MKSRCVYIDANRHIQTYVTCVCVLVTQLCLTLCDIMDCRIPGSSIRGNFPGKNTGVGCHSVLQGIFLTQGLNPGLTTLQADSLLSEPPGKPLYK